MSKATDNSILKDFNHEVEKIWSDKKRYFGLPISFTWYSMSADRIFVRRGVVVSRNSETILYRVKDISVRQSVLQKAFGVGTIILETLDQSSRIITLESVKHPEAVKEMLHSYVETAKKGASIEEILG